jgi:hypothetical protein
MLKHAVTVLVSLIFALFCTAVASIAYTVVIRVWLDRTHFFSYCWPLAHLLCAVSVLGIAVLIFGHRRDVGALLFLAGAIGLLGATLHDCFISWGLDLHWFQFGGSDGWIFRGFFEPEENRVLIFVAHTFQAISLLTYVGVFWMSATFAQRHLTKRWSRPRAVVLSRFS